MPVVSQYYVVLATLVFLALDGHLALVQVVAQSFQILPVGMIGLSREALWQVVTWSSQMFVGGILVALPVITSLLVVNLSFGVITRAAPQLNIFAVGFPVANLLGFVLILMSLSSIAPHVQDLLTQGFQTIDVVLRGGP